MATVVASGTKTADGLEDTLATVNSSGTFVLMVDVANMTNGDAVVFKLKTKILSGGTDQIAYVSKYVNAQSEYIKISIPVPSDQEIVFTLQQTAGTNRAYPWKVMSL